MQGSSNRQTNKLVIRNQQSTSKKKTSKKSGEAKKNAKKRDSFLHFMFNQRMIQIYGIIAMSFAMLLMISIFSYFFHYHTDVSHVTSSVEAPGNIAGTVGAHLSYFFVNYFFGIFSIGFVLLFFISGVQMTFNKQPLPLFKTAVTTLLTMAWCSMLLGLFFAQSGIDFIAGAFGNFTSQLLLHSTGKLVTGIIMAILFFIILILCYNVSMHSLLSLQLPKRSDHSEAIANKKKKKETPEGEVANAVATATDTKLPDLYIENRNGLSNEYRGNVYHFENDDTQEFEVSQNESVSEISFANLLDKNRSKQEETNQVPFEIIDHSLMSDSEEEMPDD
ncbi:MAG: DNA translocase FtsK 4TM domain-containing protein [Bacteroidales bacterium]